MGRGNGESITANAMNMTMRPTNVTETNQYPAFVAYHRITHVPVFFANARNLCWVCASIDVFSQDRFAYCTEPAHAARGGANKVQGGAGQRKHHMKWHAPQELG